MPSSVREDGQVGSSGGPRADRPKRRNFTAAYKAEFLEEYERLSDPSDRGALLRREGARAGRVECAFRQAGGAAFAEQHGIFFSITPWLLPSWRFPL